VIIDLPNQAIQACQTTMQHIITSQHSDNHAAHNNFTTFRQPCST